MDWLQLEIFALKRQKFLIIRFINDSLYDMVLECDPVTKQSQQGYPQRFFSQPAYIYRNNSESASKDSYRSCPVADHRQYHQSEQKLVEVKLSKSSILIYVNGSILFAICMMMMAVIPAMILIYLDMLQIEKETFQITKTTCEIIFPTAGCLALIQLGLLCGAWAK